MNVLSHGVQLHHKNLEKLVRKCYFKPEKSSYGGNIPVNQSKKSSDGEKIHDGRAK